MVTAIVACSPFLSHFFEQQILDFRWNVQNCARRITRREHYYCNIRLWLLITYENIGETVGIWGVYLHRPHRQGGGGGAAETLPQGSSGHGRPSIVRNISISTRTLFSLTIVIIMIINVVVVAGCGSDSVTWLITLSIAALLYIYMPYTVFYDYSGWHQLWSAAHYNVSRIIIDLVLGYCLSRILYSDD